MFHKKRSAVRKTVSPQPGLTPGGSDGSLRTDEIASGAETPATFLARTVENITVEFEEKVDMTLLPEFVNEFLRAHSRGRY